MSYIGNYRNRLGRNNVTDSRSLTIYEINKEFKRMLETDVCALDLKITDVDEVNITDNTKTVRVIVNDVSDNDQRAFDEKWLFIENEHNCDIGCYVLFDNCYWLINYKEHNSIGAYKKFIMKQCNQIVRYKYNDTIYDIPVVVKNLTQYSDGLQDIVYTSMPDNKLSMLYGVNYVTKNIRLGHRVMVNKEKVYRTTMIDNYQFNATYDKHDGIANATIIFTSMRDTDDRESNIADNEIDVSPVGINIIGADNVMPSGRFKYSLSEQKNTEWEVEYSGNENGYITLSKSGYDCILDIDNDLNLIGESFKLKSINNSDLSKVEKEISVTGF